MVDRARDELVAALAGDEHRRRSAGHLRDEARELLHLGMLGDEFERWHPGRLGVDHGCRGCAADAAQ